MTRRTAILLALLIPCLGFAAWQWFRPYAWNPDPAAGAEIEFVRVERDESFFWVDVYLKVTDASGHRLENPVRLVTHDDRRIEVAETTLEGSPEKKIEALSFKFWLEAADLEGPLELQLNDATLQVRDGDGVPDLDNRTHAFHRNSRW